MPRSYFGRVDDGDRRAPASRCSCPRIPGTGATSLLPDLLIAVALGVLAFVLRLNFPTDGLFHDDAWQVLGVSKGTFSDFPMVGQTQPGFTFGLMLWERMFGSGTTSMLTPALIAGSLGAAGARIWRCDTSATPVPIAALLGAMLTVAATHIVFSNRVKTYTADLLVVLLLLVLAATARPEAVEHETRPVVVRGSVIAASFSSFALLASLRPA